MANKYPLVSVVILNWNGLEDTKVCLEHVFKLDYPNYEVIVLDNGSSADQKRYLGSLKDITYVDNLTNTGFAGGHDDALPYTHGEFILLLNNDAVVKSDYLSTALPLFDDKKVAVVGGRSYFWNEDEPLLDETNMYYSYMNVNPYNGETSLLTMDYGMTQEVNTVSGSSVIIRRSVIEEVGYLYRPYFAYYEETDLFARIKRAGYKILYSPKLKIWHQNGASSGAQGGSSFFFYHIFRNRFIYAIRNFEQPYLNSFLRSYYKLGLTSIFNIYHGGAQKRLGVAYLKAIFSTILSLPTHLHERKELAQNLTNTYCKQILGEQLTISIILDARASTKRQINEALSKISKDFNYLHEYIIVVDDTSNAYPTTRQGNYRFVVNRSYFNTPAINIGCLAAANTWLILTELGDTFDITEYRSCITNLSNTHFYVTSSSNTPSSIAVLADYYREMGGLQLGSSLTENVAWLKKYASLENRLESSVQVDTISSSELRILQKQSQYNHRLIKTRTPTTRWRKILARYYRLQQLSSLVTWLFNVKVPTRLKLARIKNLLLFIVTLRKKMLATELRHIRNEVTIYSASGAASALVAEQTERIPIITKATGTAISDIPIYVICFERVDILKKLVSWLESHGMNKIVFIDNDSTYPPLDEYYNSSPYQVLRLYRNIGHTAPWSLDIIRILTPEQYYIVTDPDVIPDEDCPDDVIMHLLQVHADFPAHLKVGLGLEINDLPETYPLKNDVIAWEKQFWKTELKKNIYEAGVDTTFALYKPFTYNYTLHPSLRTGRPYIVHHMPWYTNPKHQTDEDRYYQARANRNVTSWNVDELPARYRKEIKYDEEDR